MLDFLNPTLNFAFMSNVVKAAVATLAEEAGIHNSSFVEEPIYITLTSIAENKLIKNLKAFPNPTNGILNTMKNALWIMSITSSNHRSRNCSPIMDRSV